MTIHDTAERVTEHVTDTIGPNSLARSEELATRLIASATMGVELLTIELGRRLGLYQVLFDSGAITAAEFATEAGIAERYAREWLEQQAAAGILDVVRESHSPHDREYLLPGSHVRVLLDELNPFYSVGVARMLLGVALTLPEVAEAFRTGGGVSFDKYGSELRDGIASINRPGFVHGIRQWIDTMPDVSSRLDGGGVVLDAGCGVGWSSIAIAKAFPNARVVGIDLDAASIAQARLNAAASGVADRLFFARANAADERSIRSPFGVDYSLVTVFEALHDMGQPVKALSAFRRVLAPGGAVLVADERADVEFSAPAGDIERLHYGFSVLHCLPATMAESDAVVNGTVLRAPTVRAWANRAGFDRTTELPIEHEFWRFYRVD